MTDVTPSSYLLVVDSTQKSLDDVIGKINEMDEVVNWSKIMPNSAILVSVLTAAEISHQIREVLPRQRHILTKLERGSKDGWLPRSAWSFMNNPKSVDNE